jgi:hypothetical protein
MQALLSLLFPPQLPILNQREVLIQQHIHEPFEHVSEDGIVGEVKEKKFKDAIERIQVEMSLEHIT